jgi:hypothetical protein
MKSMLECMDFFILAYENRCSYIFERRKRFYFCHLLFFGTIVIFHWLFYAGEGVAKSEFILTIFDKVVSFLPFFAVFFWTMVF